MQFNNNGYHGSFFVSTLCFSPEASKVSCVLNNDGAAACLPSFGSHVLLLKYKMTADHFPPLLPHKSPSLLDFPLIGSKLWPVLPSDLPWSHWCLQRRDPCRGTWELPRQRRSRRLSPSPCLFDVTPDTGLCSDHQGDLTPLLGCE